MDDPLRSRSLLLSRSVEEKEEEPYEFLET